MLMYLMNCRKLLNLSLDTLYFRGISIFLSRFYFLYILGIKIRMLFKKFLS